MIWRLKLRMILCSDVTRNWLESTQTFQHSTSFHCRQRSPLGDPVSSDFPRCHHLVIPTVWSRDGLLPAPELWPFSPNLPTGCWIVVRTADPTPHILAVGCHPRSTICHTAGECVRNVGKMWVPGANYSSSALVRQLDSGQCEYSATHRPVRW